MSAPILAHDIGEVSEPELFAAIIDLRDERADYDGSYCPPDPNNELICFGASVLIQKGKVHRYIGARPKANDPLLRKARGGDAAGDFLRFRFIAGHARNQIKATRYLVILEPTDAGYVYLQWREILDRGRPCFPEDVLKHYGERLQIKLGKKREDGSRCVRNF